MVLLFSLVLASLLIFLLGSAIRKHQGLAYLLTTVLACGACAVSWLGLTKPLEGVPLALCNVFLQGGLAGALFIYIMYAGALPATSQIRKRVMPIRGPLSIMASILTLGHNAGYARYYVMLFSSFSDMQPLTLAAALCSLVMDLIMLPLFVTSFLRIRRRMQPKKWKRLQRLAYIFYALMYIHVLLLNTHNARNGVWTALLNVILYSCLFIGYAVMRISKELLRKKKEGPAACLPIAGLAILACLLLFIFSPWNTSSAPASSAEKMDDSSLVYADGSYKGAALGYNGRLKVKVTVENGKIAGLKVSSHVEDEPYITDASEGVFAQILATGNTYADAVSAATTTSDALMEAIRDALKDAVVSE